MDAAIATYILTTITNVGWSVIANGLYDLTKQQAEELIRHLDQGDEVAAKKMLDKAAQCNPNIEKEAKKRKESNEKYLKKQTQNLVNFLDKMGEEKLSAELVRQYLPRQSHEKIISSTTLAEAIKKEQQAAIAEQDDDAINKLANLLSDYLSAKSFDAMLKTKVESLFTLGTSLMLVECKMDYALGNKSETGDDVAHYIAVTEEGTLELIAALLYENTPRFKPKESGLGAVGQDMSDIRAIREEGWSHQQTAERAAMAICDEIYKGRTNSLKQLPRLNSYIRGRRKRDKNLYYGMVNLDQNEEHELNNPEVLSLLKANNMLPDLPIFIIGQEGSDFMADVSAMLDGFYEDLSQYSNA